MKGYPRSRFRSDGRGRGTSVDVRRAWRSGPTGPRACGRLTRKPLSRFRPTRPHRFVGWAGTFLAWSHWIRQDAGIFDSAGARLGEVDAGEYEGMSQFRHEVNRVKQAHAEERRADDFVPHPRGLVLAPT